MLSVDVTLVEVDCYLLTAVSVSNELLLHRYAAFIKSSKWCCYLTQVILVFDALGGGSGTVQRTTAKGAIDVVYCGDSDADTFIMLEVNLLPRKFLVTWHLGMLVTGNV